MATSTLAAMALIVPLAQADVIGGYHYTGKMWADGQLPAQPVVDGHPVTTPGKARQSAPPKGARELRAHKPAAAVWPTASTSTVALTHPTMLTTPASGPNSSKAVPSPTIGAAPVLTPVRAGFSPVWVGPAPATSPTARSTQGATTPQIAPAAVTVRTADRTQAQSANVDGLLVGLTRADGKNAAGNVSVSLNYSTIAQAYGGGWASRLHLVSMPGCALSTPKVPACRVQTPLPTTNDTTGRKLSSSVVVPAATTTRSATAGAAVAPLSVAVAAVSGSGGSQGNYAATSLSSSGTWSQSATGAFTYNYPIAVPPALGGSAPSVALSYNSQSIDGETSARNSQSSWIGDGWSYSPGFIERSYKACKTDGIKDSGDECWGGYNATLSLGSHTGELVRDSSGGYHPQSDDGTKVERLTGASNGLWSGEYFKVTTTDGTAYYLGLNHAPGITSDSATNSAWSVPVYHPKSGDPCYDSAKGNTSQCDKPVGYRFNVDFSVDPHGNVQRYDYATETNYYNMGVGQVAASGAGGTMTPYTRAGYLTTISYGYKLADAQAGRDPAARVTFDTAQRCTTSDTVCKYSNLSASTATNWPDVPYDLNCPSTDKTSGEGDGVCRVGAPTFWSTYRLKSITTQVKSGSGYQDVDSYSLGHVFSDAGGVIDPVTGNEEHPENAGQLQSIMWLQSIQHTGLDTAAGGSGSVALDPITFTGIETDNRVDGLTPGAPPLYHPRISSVHTETGESIAVTYKPPACSRVNHTMPASADSNSMACYPVNWSPPGAADPIADWFNKSLVTQVTTSDLTKAGSPAKVTNYAYSGAAWHRDDSDLTDDRYRTWNDFRGFRSVTVTTGADPDPITKTVTTYLQGMDGDRRADGSTRAVDVANTLGESTADSNWLAGSVLESDTYSGAGSGQSIISKSVHDAPGMTSTAHRTRSAWTSEDPAPASLSTLPDLAAHRPQTASSRALALLANGTWRTTKTSTTYDASARVSQVDNKGDIADPKQERCTTTSYAAAPSANPMMLAYPSQTLTVSGACGTTPGTSTTISDRRIFYDGDGTTGNLGPLGQLGQTWASDGKTHSLGYATATQTVKSYDGTGQPVYQTVQATTFDDYGRTTRMVDASGTAVTTGISPATGVLPTKLTTTNPWGWTSSGTVDPARGLVTEVVDVNGRVTDSTFDALGRRTASWLPGRDKSAHPNAPDKKFAYAVHGAGDHPDPSTVTTQTLREDESYNTAITLYDGMLQARQQQSTTANNSAGRLITSSTYDSHGWPLATINAYSDPNNAPSTTMWSELETTVPSEAKTVYDGLGRPTASQLWSKATLLWQSTTAYPGADEVDTTPPTGGQSTAAFTNALGQTIATRVKDTTPNQRLAPNAVIASGSSVASNSVRLTMQADGNLVLTGINSGTVLWSSGTPGNAGASATVRTDGNLVVTSITGTMLWSSKSGTTGSTGGHAYVRDDGSLQMYNTGGQSLWSTGTTGKALAADITTRYTYTPAGQSASVADTVGNTWTYQYNLLGQKVSQTDPDAGTSFYGYDQLGRLNQTTDARGQILSLAYDALGRKTGEFNEAATGTHDPAKQLAGWTYDTLPDNTVVKGQPVASTRYVGGRSASGSAYVKQINGYTPTYQPTSITTVIPPAEGNLANTYTASAAYTPTVGLLASTTYGAHGGLPAETVGYGYDLQGLLLETGSPDTAYLDTALYSPLGQIQRSTYGDYGKQIRTAQTYDAATGRLATNTVSLQPNTFGPIDSSTYGYNQAGQLNAVSDTQSNGTTITGTDTQCFSYNGQGRLAEAWTDTKGTTTPTVLGQLGQCTTATPSAATVGGPAPYWQSFTYNLLGDRTQQVNHDPAGNALKNITQSSAYPGNGTTTAAQPNTAATITTAGPGGTTTLTPHYDAAGNTTSRDTKVGTAATTTQTLKYNAEGRTDTVTAKAGGTGDAGYIYDADGGLLIQKSTASNVLYLFGGAEQLTLDNAKKTVTGQRYYTNPDGTCIVRSSTGTVTYQPTNPQHTAQLQINAASLAVTRRAYDPYGAPRGTAPAAWADNHGYLGQPADTTTGLNLLGARNYDPVLGRFLTVDPVFEAGDPNQMGGYTYSGNDPVNGSDPSGLREEWGAAGGGYGDDPGYTTPDPPADSGGDDGGDDDGCSGFWNCAGRLIEKAAPVVVVVIVTVVVVSAVAVCVGETAGIASPVCLEAGATAVVTTCGALMGDCGPGAGESPSSEAARDEPRGSSGAAHDAPGGGGARPRNTGDGPVRDEAPPAAGSDTSTATHDPTTSAPAAKAAEPAAPSKGAGGTKSTGGCSFAPDTPVLMSDGNTKPIADIKSGDQVEAADPASGKLDGPHTVTATIVNHDKDLVDVDILGPDGVISTLHTTSEHPIWDATTHTWVPAGKLIPGHTLTTNTAHEVRVTAVRTTPGEADRYNLTVAELHTYYVLAGQTPVLVHNTCGDDPAVLYRSPGTGKKASESNGLNAANHGGDHPTAYLSNLPEGAAHYAGNGHDLGMHVFGMKPGFREAFGDLEFPLENSMGLTEGLTEWRIPAGRFDEFNSYIDHNLTEWWDAADGHFFPPPGSIHSP
ncbi:hypothetical protein C8250_007935 [Streptomyces sp. So13.3]|uniref:polymorphic toxin-type HINT domain-containing protein n=1 Tax=Streptomyces sp. So13.3 TaxID=2136173 RepID=UPI001105B4D3|nr:polymorphic toxin-type HINT domain-containing protein [Streptomyces sp. So13.3]QNA71840.1 hypothetical protein C8250_007935 [Streptomyces sp. So13.3]